MAIIRSLPLLVFLFMLTIPVAMVAMMVWVAMRTRTRAKIVAATPTANVGFAADGYVELEGHAQAIDGRTITTPLTGIECVWYRARLERWRRGSGNDEATWNTLRDVTSSDPFVLKDGTGTCLVFPGGAEVTFTDRSVWFGADVVPDDKNPARTGPGDSAEGMVRIYGTSGKEYRYTEERIYAGDPLYVLGQFSSAKWEEDVEEDEVDDQDDQEEIGAEGAPEDTEETDEEVALAGMRDAWDPFEREEAMIAEATKLTSRRVTRPASQPYLLSTTPQAKFLDVQNQAWKGALGVAIVPAAITALLVWLRFG